MRLENVQDPRWVLCRQKYFGLRPEPLEQYLYSLGLQQTAERVFWLHWDAGARRGDFTSELSLREVARRCHCDVSSVTRAYQTLKRSGLLRRQDPGRDPRRPFDQAIAVTEVLMPRDSLGKLLSAPDRAVRLVENTQLAAAPASDPAPTPVPKSAASTGISEPLSTDLTSRVELTAEAVASAPDPSTHWGECLGRLRQEVSESDFNTWLLPLQAYGARSKLVLYAPNRFVVEWVQKQVENRISALMAELVPGLKGVEFQVGSRPTAKAVAAAANTAARRQSPRRLGTFQLARLRQRLSQLVLDNALDSRFLELAWSIEQGGLAKMEMPKAMNIALKLVREGKWTRPNRMPPNWRCGIDAPVEACRAA